MAIKIMALVDPQGNVVNKIIMDIAKPFSPPPGWSMHEWNDSTDGPAYEAYLQSMKGAGQ